MQKHNQHNIPIVSKVKRILSKRYLILISLYFFPFFSMNQRNYHLYRILKIANINVLVYQTRSLISLCECTHFDTCVKLRNKFKIHKLKILSNYALPVIGGRGISALDNEEEQVKFSILELSTEQRTTAHMYHKKQY